MTNTLSKSNSGTEKAYFMLSFQVTVKAVREVRQEPKQKLGAETTEDHCLLAHSWLAQANVQPASFYSLGHAQRQGYPYWAEYSNVNLLIKAILHRHGHKPT